MKNIRKNITRPVALAAVTILLLAGGTFAYFAKDHAGQSSTESTESKDINFGPPTEEEQKSGDKQKEDIVDQLGSQAQQPGNKTATVIITDAGQYDNIVEVRAFIPDHYQDGTCTTTFRQGNQIVTKESAAYRDASTTICTNPEIKRSEFLSAGNWQLIVTYKSKDAQGQSEPQTVIIE